MDDWRSAGVDGAEGQREVQMAAPGNWIEIIPGEGTGGVVMGPGH